jgi:hypothetical protein
MGFLLRAATLGLAGRAAHHTKRTAREAVKQTQLLERALRDGRSRDAGNSLHRDRSSYDPQPLPAPAGTGQVVFSPDGRYLWDGVTWIPVPPRAGRRKSKLLNFLASFFVPGLGSMLARRVLRGSILFVLSVGAGVAGLVIEYQSYGTLTASVGVTNSSGTATLQCVGACLGVDSTSLTILGLYGTSVLVWIAALIDAVVSTARYNRESGWLY